MTQTATAGPAPSDEAAEAINRYLSALEDPQTLVDREAIRSLQEQHADATTPAEQVILDGQIHAAMNPGESAIADAATEFAKVAKTFSTRHNIPVGSWERAGVPADVLEKAGLVPRTSRNGSVKRPAPRNGSSGSPKRKSPTACSGCLPTPNGQSRELLKHPVRQSKRFALPLTSSSRTDASSPPGSTFTRAGGAGSRPSTGRSPRSRI